jgi:hypothetical protein
MFRHASVFCLAIALCAQAARAHWSAPKDGLVTDKQVAGYVDVMKQFMTSIRKVDQTIEGEPGLVTVVATLRGTAIFERALAGSGMTEAEFDWVNARVSEAWRGVKRERRINGFKDEVADEQKKIQQNLTEVKQRLALHQKALKEGRRVMDAAQRKDIAEASAEAQKAPLAEAGRRADEAKAAEAEAARAEANARAAEAALKNPPKFADDDSRKAFVSEKSEALGRAKDAKERALLHVVYAKKIEAENRAEAAAFAARAKDPDLAITDNEKAAAKGENEDAIKQLSDAIARLEAEGKSLEENLASGLKSLTDDPRNKAPAQNVAALRKHRGEYEALLGVKK